MATAVTTPRRVGSDLQRQGEQSPRVSRSPSSSEASFRTPPPSGFMERVQAKVRSDAEDREDIVHSIFGEVGTPVEDFSCAVESRILLHGRMYVTSTFVCFYSNLFGFEKIIKIPFCHMRCITKEKTALFIPNAIAIITSKKEYIFRSFWDREDAFKTLKRCQQESNSLAAAHASATASLLMEPPPPVPVPQENGGLDISGNRDNEDVEQSQRRRQQRRRSGSYGGSSHGSRGGSDKEMDDKDKGPRSAGSRRRLLWPGKGDRKGSSSSIADHGLSVSAPNSRNASSSSINVRAVAGGSSVSISTAVATFGTTTTTATTDVTDDADPTPPKADASEKLPPSPSDRVGEETAEAGAVSGETDAGEEGIAAAKATAAAGGGSVASTEGGGAAVGGSAGLAISDEYYESEVDVLGVEGSPVTAVSLGATTGGGSSRSSKAEDFETALTALGEGWVIGGGGSVGGNGDLQQKQQRSAQATSKGATVRISTDIPCQLQEFFRLFISNDAEKGIPAFHESLGDSDVKATPWKVAGGALGMTREIRFVHPVSAPIGPNSTRAVKLQRCRLYDEHGLILETSTHLEDIVMSDYFQIDDRCVVQPGPDGGATVRVDVEVEIKFFKSTMFRKTIESKSLSETRQVWESFIGMTKEAIEKRRPALPLRNPSGGDEDDGNESDDEGRIRATRERLRERRKHRHRARNNHPPPHPHDLDQKHPPEPPLSSAAASRGVARARAESGAFGKAENAEATRPRAKSAAATTMPPPPPPPPLRSDQRRRGLSGAVIERRRGSSSAAAIAGSDGKRGAGYGNGGVAVVGRAGERKVLGSAAANGGVSSGGGSVMVTPLPSVTRWLFSFAAVPWLLLLFVFLVEVLEYSRFSSETTGYLEAAETALAALGASSAAAEEGSGGATVSGVPLKEELARGLMRIYCRHRFLWPFRAEF